LILNLQGKKKFESLANKQIHETVIKRAFWTRFIAHSTFAWLLKREQPRLV